MEKILKEDGHKSLSYWAIPEHKTVLKIGSTLY
jgi:hypothetical protein